MKKTTSNTLPLTSNEVRMLLGVLQFFMEENCEGPIKPLNKKIFSAKEVFATKDLLSLKSKLVSTFN